MRTELRDELEAALDGELIRFFPSAVDGEGGFHCGFDAGWNRRPPARRLCVYQARMTWVAATVALRRPDRRDEHLAYARHGVDALLGTFADRDAGGFFWQTLANGRTPDAAAGRKLLYGEAFALYALSAAAHATGDPPTLRAAVAAFEWVDRVLHDAVHGGYAEAAHRDDQVVGADDATEGAADGVSIGTPPGHKSINAQIYMLEAVTELYRAWPDPRAGRRLEELIGLIAVRLPDSRGFLPAVYHADWTPLEGLVSYGHDVETACLLADAAATLGRPDDPAVWATAARLWDNTFRYGVDADHGGVFDVGRPGSAAYSTKKVWWVQAEAVRSLLMMHERFGKTDGRYGEAADRVWAFCRRNLIDPAGGWRGEVSADGRTVLADARAHNWKACYHTARATLDGVETLDRIIGPDGVGSARSER